MDGVSVQMSDISPESRVDMVMASIRQRLSARTLVPGSRLPSIRQCAELLSVSPSTVAEAYARLEAEGVIAARAGSGFYVARAAVPLSLAEMGPRVDRAIDPFWVSRQSLEAGEADLKPGCGWLPPSWLPEDSLRKAMRGVARSPVARLMEYDSPLGFAPLRHLITRRMAEHGIGASPAQVILTESGTQSIDLVCRFLLEPGDTVLVDDPCYFNFQAILRAHRAKIVSVPYTATGPDTEAFARVLTEHKPRLYITNSAIHNPTGAVLAPVTAHRILKLAEQHSLTIIEDDIFADFEHTSAPRLAAFDGVQRVIHIGSFSKTLSAAARCGYIVARPDWVEELTNLKIATSFGGSGLTAALVHAVLSDGGYRRHIEALRERLASAMATVTARLSSLGIMPSIEPQAGLFLWCRLPDGVDAADVARAALAHRIVLAPGNVFSPGRTAGGFMRFNVSQSLDPRVMTVLKTVLSKRHPAASGAV